MFLWYTVIYTAQHLTILSSQIGSRIRVMKSTKSKKFSKSNEPLNSTQWPPAFTFHRLCCHLLLSSDENRRGWQGMEMRSSSCHPVTQVQYEPISSEFVGPASDCRDLIAPTKVSWSQPQSGSIPVFACCVCVFWSGKAVWGFFLYNTTVAKTSKLGSSRCISFDCRNAFVVVVEFFPRMFFKPCLSRGKGLLNPRSRSSPQ